MKRIDQEGLHEMICIIRGHKVMLDHDLARLYEVPTKVLVQAVKRNKARFPEDFMFRLSKEELGNWRSQFVTSNSFIKMGLRRPPYAFTEHGVSMLSSVLRSDRAIQINIMIMRAFARLRQMVSLSRALAKRLASVERRLSGHDADVVRLYTLIQQMQRPAKEVGFKWDSPKG